MKTLLLIRHGKSGWSAGVSDMKRQLNHQGLGDAVIMAKILKYKSLIPELMYVSSATRATQTANILTGEWDTSQANLIQSPELYLCDAFATEELIHFAPKHTDRLAIVGHNPTLSEVAYSYSQQRYVDMPPLGIYVFTFDTNDWSKVSAGNVSKQYLLSPKLFK